MDREVSAKLEVLFKTKLNSAMRMYLETCARCGVCVKACHVYNSMPETKYTAVGRAEVVRKLFRAYFKLEGKIAPWLGETVKLDDVTVDELYDAAFSCTGCRRCVTYCPFGIDTQMIMAIAKALVIGADKAPAVLSILSDMSIAKGESIAETAVAYEEAIRNLESDVKALWAEPWKPGAPFIPIGVKGADVLYVALSGAHSIVSAAAIMNAAKENWSLSYFEAVNFGAFLGDAAKAQAIAKRITDEAVRLGVKEVAIVECGTAFRFMKYMTGRHPFKVSAFVELIDRYVRGGQIKLDDGKIDGTVTYHDPCQIARNGGVFEEPRNVIAHLTKNYVELKPSREDNWCCGGGGGLISMGELDFRMKSSRVKADQLRSSGAKVVTTACENCHSQLVDLNEHYGLGMRVEFLSHIVAKALMA
ncbi:MAG: (Fe-S)-binding protein [Treponemataceae bacterium]